MQKRTRKKEIIRRINCVNKFNKLDYSIYNNSTYNHNKSIDFHLNKSNNKLNTTDSYFKETVDKNKTIISSQNNYFNKNANNVCRITASNILYSKTLKDGRPTIKVPNHYLFNNYDYQNSYNSTLKENKQNININNNIIININNSNCETLNTSTNKTIKSKNNSKNKNKRKYKNDSKEKNNKNKNDDKDRNNSKNKNDSKKNNNSINKNDNKDKNSKNKNDNKDKNNSKNKNDNKDKNNNKIKNNIKVKINSYSINKINKKILIIKIPKEEENKKYFHLKEKEINDKINNIDLDEYKYYINSSHITNNQVPKEYLNIIYYNLLKEEELIPMPIYNYMNDQQEINEQMRSILIDWIIDVHFKFGFTDETLFMTVLIIDRFASIRQISRMKFQLLGITALMIACKHEEIDLPKIDDFIYITDNAYTKQEMIKMEYDILCALNFSLLYPSPIKFYEYLSINFNFSKKLHFMGKYLMENFLVDIKSIKYKPSVISCACAYIVMKFFNIEGYQESYNKKFYMLNENEDLPLKHGVKDCAQEICILVDNIDNSNYLACCKKYSRDEFENVSLIIDNK